MFWLIRGCFCDPPPRPGRSVRQPFPDWVDYRPNQSWIYDTTHFTRAGVAVTVIEDLVSRKWIADIVSAQETSTQVQIVVTDALAAEGLLALVEARADGLVDPTQVTRTAPCGLNHSPTCRESDTPQSRRRVATN